MSIFCNSFFLGVLRDAAVIDAMRWHGDCDTVFHVINRSSGEATKVVYTSESFFFLHTINAYEEVGTSTGCDDLFENEMHNCIYSWRKLNIMRLIREVKGMAKVYSYLFL